MRGTTRPRRVPNWAGRRGPCRKRCATRFTGCGGRPERSTCAAASSGNAGPTICTQFLPARKAGAYAETATFYRREVNNGPKSPGISLAPPASMDIQDGFIVSIFNYCDSWCAACAFTSRCRLFADSAEFEASLDPTLKPVVDEPPLPEDVPPEPPAWMQELLEGAAQAVREASTSGEQTPPLRRTIPLEHEALRERAKTYVDS